MQRSAEDSMKARALSSKIFGVVVLALSIGSVVAAQAPEGPAAQPPVPAQTEAPKPPARQAPATDANPPAAKSAKIEVPIGTKLPLVLHNAVSTRSARPGDPVYLETLFPIILDGKILIPAGSFVGGEIVETKRAGRVKGRAELLIKLNTLILPNGYVASFNAVPSNAGTGGGESTDDEGKIKGDTDKASDIGTIAKTTTAGAGIGAIAGRSAAGAGIGAGIGAAAGLLGVLLSRGPDAEMPRGTTLDVTLNRPMFLEADKINFTTPGQASTLAGPSNREPQRSKIPF
jgi:type IV secretion system protein VirB10